MPVTISQKEKADEKGAAESEATLEEGKAFIATGQHRFASEADGNDDETQKQKKAFHGGDARLQSSQNGVAHFGGIDACFLGATGGDVARAEAIADGRSDCGIDRIGGGRFTE